MKLASMLRRLRNTQGGGARSAARSRSTPYTPYTNGPFGPVAHAGSDQTVSVKTKVYFDGSDSTDPDGGNLYYSWAFGAGAKPATGRGVKPSCTYTTTGDKTVTLTVRDTDNNVASDTVTITVEPVAEAGSDQIVDVGDTVSFDGSGSEGSNLSYLWAFGDKANPTASGSGVRVSYTYPTTGDKTVTLTVTDTVSGLTAQDTLTITVISIEPKTVNDGESVDFEVLGAASATVFSWGWRLPSDLGLNPVVGNSPGVVFLPPKPTQSPNTTTIDRAKWYAHPNVACGAENRIASRSSKYTITCNIIFSNGRSFTATSTLTVNVPWQEAGLVRPGIKIITYETETVVEDNIEVLKIKEETLKAERVFEEVNLPPSFRQQ